jgi:hypothetical protein
MTMRPLARTVLLAAGVCLGGTLFAADANLTLQSARKLYEMGDYNKALKEFVTVLKTDPDNTEAREYMLRCSQKIMERKVDAADASLTEKKISIDKELLENALPAAPAPREPVEAPAPPPSGAGAGTGAEVSLEVSGESEDDSPGAVSRMLAREKERVAEDYKRRFAGQGSPVDVQPAGKGAEVTVYLNRLFLPFSDVLNREAYPALAEAAAKLRRDVTGKVILTAIDDAGAAPKAADSTLSSRRCTVVFTYLLYASLVPDASALIP